VEKLSEREKQNKTVVPEQHSNPCAMEWGPSVAVLRHHGIHTSLSK